MIGLSIALALRENGADVTSFECDTGVCKGSSGQGGSSLGLIDKKTGPMHALAQSSIQTFQRWLPQLGGNWLHMSGGLVPIRPGEEVAGLEVASNSTGVHWLEQDDISMVSRLLDQDRVVGALYLDQEGRIDVGEFGQRALTWLSGSGGWRLIRGRVSEVQETGSEARIRLADSVFRFDSVVIAPGYDYYGLLETLGQEYSLTPCRGLILSFDRPGIRRREPIMLGLPYVLGRYSGHGAAGAVEDREISFSLEVLPSSIRIGSSREYVGFRTDDTEETAAMIASEASTYLRVDGEPLVTVCWRPVSRSGTPLAGRLPGATRIFCGAGFEGHGVCMSSGIGVALADYVIDGACPSCLVALDPCRTP